MDATVWKNSVEWGRYQARLKFQRDQNMYVKDAHDSGVNEGRQVGREEGLKEGAVQRIQIFQRLLNVPMAPGEGLLSLTLDELNAKAAELEAQLGSAIKQ